MRRSCAISIPPAGVHKFAAPADKPEQEEHRPAMGLSPLTFTGASSFSEDFQTILKRATTIASLPIRALENQQKDLVTQKVLLSNLSQATGALASVVTNLASLGEKKGLVATSSNPAKVTATNINASAAAVYTIANITSTAKAAAETSLTGYADSTAAPVSSTGIVKLIHGSNQYTIDVSGSNNLTGLRNAINTLGAGVTATVLTTGTGATPYYLSITANSAGATTLELRDDPTGANTNLLTANNQGADTVFTINGVPVSKKTTFINDVVPGLTLDILGTTAGAESVTLTLATDRSKLSDAIQDLVATYNILRDQVDAQIGENAGLLSGDYLVREIQSRMRALASYQGSGSSIKNLAHLGFELDSNGRASFNSQVFDSLSDSQITEAFTFLGSATTGLGALATSFSSISDPLTGLAKIQIDKYDETNSKLSTQITAISDRVSDMQRILSAKLQAADALLAGLQSQQKVLDASLKSLNLTLYGREDR
jgi:flagellar hook-associated protein 2